MKKQKRYVKIYKDKEECFLCERKTNLTYHHIIPKREIVFNGYDNILVICRKCHNIIDLSFKQRDDNCYNKHKIIIDAYNKYLIDKKFDIDLIWKLYVEEEVVIKKVKKKPKKRKRGIGINENCVTLDEYKKYRDNGKLNNLLARKSKTKYIQ